MAQLKDTTVTGSLSVTNSTTLNAGATVTGDDLNLYIASGDSPAVVFQRGSLSDNYNDWRIQDRSGILYFDERGSGSSTWTNRASINTTGVLTATTLAGSLEWSYVNSKPTIPTALSISGNTISLKSGDTVMSSISLPVYNGSVT